MTDGAGRAGRAHLGPGGRQCRARLWGSRGRPADTPLSRRTEQRTGGCRGCGVRDGFSFFPFYLERQRRQHIWMLVGDKPGARENVGLRGARGGRGAAASQAGGPGVGKTLPG